MPGGDQQEQWALHAFLRDVDLGLDLQAAIDAPEFHTDHLISSFHPRGFVREIAPRSSPLVRLEDGGGARAPRARGHALARMVARPRDRGRARAERLRRAGANARGMQGYAVGR